MFEILFSSSARVGASLCLRRKVKRKFFCFFSTTRASHKERKENKEKIHLTLLTNKKKKRFLKRFESLLLERTLCGALAPLLATERERESERARASKELFSF